MGSTWGVSVLALVRLLFWATVVHGSIWRMGAKSPQPARPSYSHTDDLEVDPFDTIRDSSRLPNIYAVAIQELQDMESQPLCHRTAAKFLVNDCRMLEGKDEATVLTDSGHQVRDFVDFYAASLAICDLERGGFVIPSACAKFREGALAGLPTPRRAMLHVSSKEIDGCLSGLARVDSAWNTWVSYRHKALRFCEAARADHEKAQNIHLYQRLTKVLADLTEGVESEVEKRMNAFDIKIRETEKELENLTPNIDQLRDGLDHVTEIIKGDLERAAEESVYKIRGGLEDAANLQQVLAVLLKTVLQHNAEMASSHDSAVATIEQRSNEGFEVLMTALTAAVASSASLETQMEQSRLHAIELAQRQLVLESGLIKILDLTHDLSAKYADHNDRLDQANEKTEDLLSALNDAATSANTIHGSLFKVSGAFGLWPYVVCPVISLVMGSYGLPPSGFRNLGLIALGEFLGLALTSANDIAAGYYRQPGPSSYDNLEGNSTLNFTPVVSQATSLFEGRERELVLD